MCEAFYYEANCPSPMQRDVHGDAITTTACWRHETELPCDIVFTSQAYVNRSFFVVTLEYHPDFGKTKEKKDTFGEDHVDPALHPDEGWRSNFVHPIIRYFTGLKYDGSLDPNFEAVNPDLAQSSAESNRWQNHRAPSPVRFFPA